jgi:hypothetical protein
MSRYTTNRTSTAGANRYSAAPLPAPPWWNRLRLSTSGTSDLRALLSPSGIL